MDLGGFLGLDAHKVALTPDEVQGLQPAEGRDLRVSIDAAKENREALPECEG